MARRSLAAKTSPPTSHAREPILIYERDLAQRIQLGSGLIGVFNGVVLFSTYDVFFGAFGKAAQGQLGSLLSVLKFTSVVTCTMGVVIAARWVRIHFGMPVYINAARRPARVLPRRCKGRLRVARRAQGMQR